MLFLFLWEYWTLLLLFKAKRGYGVGNQIIIFSLLFRDYAESSSRDKSHQKNCWQLITLYLESAQDVFEHKNKQDLSESKLLGRSSRENLACRKRFLYVGEFLGSKRVGVLGFHCNLCSGSGHLISTKNNDIIDHNISNNNIATKTTSLTTTTLVIPAIPTWIIAKTMPITSSSTTLTTILTTTTLRTHHALSLFICFILLLFRFTGNLAWILLYRLEISSFVEEEV